MKVFDSLCAFGALKLFCYIVQCHIRGFVSDLISSWVSFDITRCQKMSEPHKHKHTQTSFVFSCVWHSWTCFFFARWLHWNWPTGCVVSPWQVVEFLRYRRVPSSSWRQSASNMPWLPTSRVTIPDSAQRDKVYTTFTLVVCVCVLVRFSCKILIDGMENIIERSCHTRYHTIYLGH